MNPPRPAPSARPILVRAEENHVWDADGRRYLDATSGAFCMQLGYSRADLVRAMAEAATRLPHARPTAFDSTEAASYRSALLQAAGPPYTRALLTSSGSEAVDAAIKMAWWYQRAHGRGDRREIRTLHGHYHGATLAALDATGLAARRAPFEAFLGARAFGPAAHCVRCFRGLRFPECALACVEAALESTDRAAAFLAETVPAAGLAAAVPPEGWTARVRRRCDEAGLLWIADEVLTGFGRVGALFAWQRLGDAAPDLVVFGKGASAGYFPLAGVLVAEPVADALESGGAPFRHAQTFGGNPIACAVGRAALAAYAEEGIFDRVCAAESGSRNALATVSEHDAVLELRGLGALWGVELAQPAPGRPPFPRASRVAESVESACRARGVLVHAAAGFTGDGQGDAILLAPPLTADAATMEVVARALLESIQELVPPGSAKSWIEAWEDR